MPVLAKYYIENHSIEVVKAYFGNEKVLIDGVTISEDTSGEGAEHEFKIEADNYCIYRREASQAEKLNPYEILKNGAPVALIDRKSRTPVQMLILIIVVGLGCGFLIGVLLFTML